MRLPLDNGECRGKVPSSLLQVNDSNENHWHTTRDKLQEIGHLSKLNMVYTQQIC